MKWLTIDEVAEIFKVNRNTIRRWCSCGLKCYRPTPKIRFFREEDLERWIMGSDEEEAARNEIGSSEEGGVK